MSNKLTRRTFIAGTALGLAGCTASKPRVRYSSPNSKLNIAGIGVGGRGRSIIGAVAGENIVALCDVDDRHAADSFNQWQDAKKYSDYRVMLEQQKDIDAVTIGTPDHSHAPAALLAMSMGIHVYVEKPLTHTIYETRILRKAARRYGVVTQMGNQGHAGDGARRICETVWSGLIGEVREVHAWTDRPSGWWPQNVKLPVGAQPVPEHIDWDLWVGPSPFHAYNREYFHPFAWRGWWDYGCGALGDMGCHILDPVFWAMRLGEAETYTVEPVESEGGNEETGPAWVIVRYEFPVRGEMPPVTVTWYDGGKRPTAPEGVSQDVIGGNGSLFIGSEGAIVAGAYGDNPRLLPEEKMKDFTFPEEFIPRAAGGNPHQEWVEGCKGGRMPGSNFEYSAPLTEFVHLGNVAFRAGKKIRWDVGKMLVVNDPNANRFVTKEYRKGWEFVLA